MKPAVRIFLHVNIIVKSCLFQLWVLKWNVKKKKKKGKGKETLDLCIAFGISLFVIVQSLSGVWLFGTTWTAAHQASLFIRDTQTLLKFRFVESIMPSSHLILCCSILLLALIFPSIRVFSSESGFHIRWPRYWSFSFSISPSNDIQDWSPLEWTGWITLQSKGLSRVFSNTRVQKHQIFNAQPFLLCNSQISSGLLEKS